VQHARPWIAVPVRTTVATGILANSLPQKQRLLLRNGRT
jgi:hypothetical protein